MRSAVRWTIRGASALAAFIVLLLLEALVAKVRAPDLTGFPSPALDGRIGSATGEALRITWVGDSTGEGTGASSPERSLPHLFARGLGRPVDLTVLAVCGARVDDALADQMPMVAASRPDWVVVGIGSNDVTGLTPPGLFRQTYTAILDGVAAVDPERTIVLGIGEFAAPPLFWQPLRAVAGFRGHQLESDQRSIVAERDVTFVDILHRTGPSFVSQPDVFHAADGFHPSDEGYALWADAMLDTLKKTV